MKVDHVIDIAARLERAGFHRAAKSVRNAEAGSSLNSLVLAARVVDFVLGTSEAAT